MTTRRFRVAIRQVRSSVKTDCKGARNLTNGLGVIMGLRRLSDDRSKTACTLRILVLTHGKTMGESSRTGD